MMLLPPFPTSFLLLVLFLPLLTPNAAVSPPSSTTTDATALLAFKSKADPRNCLPYNSSSHLCIWEGVQCSSQQQHQRVTKLILQDLPLSGIFPPNTLSLLDQLRVLSLQNLSLSGPIPDLFNLRNLKSLFLDHNSFSGSFPPSLTLLHRLKTLDLSQNNLTGPLPGSLNSLDRLNSLNLQFNRFNGPLPRLNHSYLVTFNISYNNLTGPIPVTPTLLRFDPSSFASNPGLCGKIVHKECRPGSPFFGATPVESGSSPPPTAAALGQSEELHGVDEPKRPVSDNRKKHKTTEVIVVFCAAVFVLVCSLLCFVVTIKRKRRINDNQKECYSEAGGDVTVGATSESRAVMHMELQGSELEEKVKRVQQAGAVEKSGSLVFCAGEAQLYTLDQLMRASAELLGRGTMGTTYKAVLDNRLIVGVKRLDAGKLRGTGKEVFERHMESVGGLRHPNLVPLRAYFQGKDERLLIYDYQPNGSLLSLIHGSKSNRAKPLHWTSCLKIAEDIVQGISYIHQAWRLVHGNLKSSNVLLGPDFEACVSDYCLSILAQNSDDSDHQDPDTTAYIAPEIAAARNHQHQAQPTSKSDVYSFGILLMEILTGKPPSQLPDLAPDEMVTWVRFVREEFDTGGGGDADDDKLEMLIEVAIGCSLASPEQRPTMWQVLKMLQEIKEAVLGEDRDQSDPPHIDSTAAS